MPLFSGIFSVSYFWRKHKILDRYNPNAVVGRAKKTAPLTKIRGAAIMSIEKVLAARVSSRTLLINKKIDYTSLEGCGDQSFLFCLLSMYCKTFNVMSMV